MSTMYYVDVPCVANAQICEKPCNARPYFSHCVETWENLYQLVRLGLTVVDENGHVYSGTQLIKLIDFWRSLPVHPGCPPERVNACGIPH